MKMFMKNNKIIWLIVFSLFFSGIPFSRSDAADQKGAEANISRENISVDATNTLGKLLTNPINDEVQKQEENQGCNIFSIEVMGKSASVSFETTENAALIVAVYDESGVSMLGSGSQDVNAGDTETVVTIDCESMPEYFYLRGFLVDPEGFKPICTAYESPNYTQDMQEFFQSTTGDYEEERVLNLDGDDSNNFLVYTEGAVRVRDISENVNRIVSEDDENLIYIIENPDESVRSLQKDNILSLERSDGTLLIIKVDSIELEGDTATIKGQQNVDIKEVFDFVKIHETIDMEGAEIDDSTCDEGVIYNGLVDSVETLEEPSRQSRDIVSDSKQMDYDLADIKLGDVSLKGHLQLCFDSVFEYYLTIQNTYVSFKIDYSGTMALDLAAKASGEVQICEIGFSAYGVNVSFTPKILFDANAKVNVTGSIIGSVGFSCSLQEGMKNLTTQPLFKANATGEFSLYVGFQIVPEINFISAHFAMANMTATVGGAGNWQIKIFNRSPGYSAS